MQKILFVLTIVFIAVLSGNDSALAFAPGDQDCLKCHSLSAEQAKEALKTLIPDVVILGVQPGPIKGTWEIGMESGGKKSVLYIDFSKKTLIAGNIFDISTRANYTQDSLSKINKIDYTQIPLDNSVVMGDKDAKYRIIVFDDPE